MRTGYKFKKNKLNGKICWFKNKNNNPNLAKINNHYVYVRKEYKNGDCLVSSFTSLEDRKHNIKFGKMHLIANGLIYSIPKPDCNFSRWTALNKDTQVVKKSNLSDIGKRHIKNKHHFMIGKHI